MPGGWENSDRAARLPADWDARKAEADRRNPRRVCHWCGEPGGTELDHKIRGDDHSQENLDWIHGRNTEQGCHGQKSSVEGNDTRWARHRARRAGEVHPAYR